MRRWWLVLLLVGTASANPSGRIVRVERERAATEAGPLVCDIYESLHGLCVGRTPKHGDVITIVDDAQVLAEVAVSKLDRDGQRCDGLWGVSVELVHGTMAQQNHDRIGVVDGGGDPRGLRKLDASEIGGSPSGNPEEMPILAIDRNNDRRADIVVTRYPCDGSGHPAANAPDHCLDVWSRRAQTFVKTSQTNLTACAMNSRP